MAACVGLIANERSERVPTKANVKITIRPGQYKLWGTFCERAERASTYK